MIIHALSVSTGVSPSSANIPGIPLPILASVASSSLSAATSSGVGGIRLTTKPGLASIPIFASIAATGTFPLIAVSSSAVSRL